MNDCCLLHAWPHTLSHHIGEGDVGKIGGVCRCVSSRLKWKGQARVEVGCSSFSKRFCLKYIRVAFVKAIEAFAL